MRKLSNKREAEIRALRKEYLANPYTYKHDTPMEKLADYTGDLLAEITRLRNSQFDIVFEPADD